MIKEQYKYSALTEGIIGCAIRVHQTLGNGFQEVIYQRALELEMRTANFSFAREFEMPIFYMSQKIGTRRVDFLVQGVVSVELKALTKLEDVHLAQGDKLPRSLQPGNWIADQLRRDKLEVQAVCKQKIQA